MNYKVNDFEFQYEAEGERTIGPPQILLDTDEDLTLKTQWKETGFTIEQLFDSSTYRKFEQTTRKLLLECWSKAGLKIPANFDLTQYHTLASAKETHMAAVENTKLLDVSRFPVDITILENRISEICHTSLAVKNPFDSQTIFHYRVIRPNSKDNNPLHRDVWLEDYKDCINLYIPIAGSNPLSSLILLPGSHRWPESLIERTKSGAIINGIKYNVPAVTSITGEFETVRPNPAQNEVLIFSPYLIHGGAVNLHSSQTRISIEIRLWKKS